jgi:tRNA A-37 threonylcarbamoyl transferase component Bud32
VWHFPLSTERFTDWSIESHELAHGTHQGSRRYFVSTDRFAKTYQLTGPRRLTNKSEYESEISSLSTLTGLGMVSVEVPTLHDHGETDDYAYVVTDRIAGRRLSELLGLDDSPAVLPIVEAVFRQLAELESHGYYHNDLRAWNVFVDAHGQARLIDFGAITRDARDVGWPHDVLAGALLFAIEVCRGRVDRAWPFRAPLFSPVWVDGALHQWFNTVWETPRAAWCFRLFHELLLTAAATSSRIPLRTPAIPSENTVYWMGLIESLLYEATDAFPYREMEERAVHAEARAQEAEAKGQEAEARAQEAEAQFAAILRGASWRITRPLRWAKRTVLRFSRPWGSGRRARRWAAVREVSRSAIPTGPAGDTVPSDLEHLPVSAREVFDDLERALERRGR